MKQISNRVQFFCILGLAAAATVVGVRVLAAKTAAPKHYNLGRDRPKVLVEVAGESGKVVSAQGESYTCSPQDAAVLWISSTDGDGFPTSLNDPDVKERPRVVDSKGDTYPFTFETKGSLCLVRVFRGFAKKPDSLTLRIPRAGRRWKTIYPNDIEITKIADPVRVVGSPSANAAEGEKIVVANWDPAKPDSFRVRIRREATSAAETSGRFYRLKLLQTSFQPQGPDKTPVASIIGKDSDAVQVQIDEYKRLPSEADLDYKHATIADVNGIRTLRLPATEDVGEIGGVKATIKQRLSLTNVDGAGPAIGDLVIMLDRKSAKVPNILVPTAGIMDVSPNVDQMGLARLRVRLENYTFGRDFVAVRSKGSQTVTDIPDLRIKVQVLTPKLISTKVYTLPVEHRHIDLDRLPTELDIQQVIAANSLLPTISLAKPPKMWRFNGGQRASPL